MAYDIASYEAVIGLLGTGLSDYRIAAQTGVNRSTVRNWRLAAGPPQTVKRAELAAAWSIQDMPAYCYLLGAYLGDGTVHTRKGIALNIVNDRRYPGVSREILGAMARTFPGRSPRVHPSSTGESDILCISHPAVVRAFPQHGVGRKHLRPIVLADWQLELTRAYPASLVRGLIHSDGCRVVNRFKTKLPSGRVAEYSYVRYFFSNLSSDIRQIFRDHCELLGIRVTQSNHRNLTVAHRRSVAILEEVVGPKT
ncbi:MAG TPA: hypothetical protein VMA77_12745 [Solirubrobacteraceae bacterium]|nr:hypothetical protein [Solirubrobacteraceae bacterium]